MILPWIVWLAVVVIDIVSEGLLKAQESGQFASTCQKLYKFKLIKT